LPGVKLSAIAIVAVLLSLEANAVAGEVHAVALASVARQLGFTYVYLGPDDEVSLTGHGLAVVVRPGAPYFTVNDRVEPVEGDAPRYQGGDLFVSPAFAHQLTTIERSAAKSERAERKTTAASALHINDSTSEVLPHHVLTVRLAQVPGTEDVVVAGEATPGALVAIVLKADAAPDLPTIYLNRSFAVAGSDGMFSLQIVTAPDYLTGSILIAEASGIDDSKPMTARFTPKGK